MTDDLILKAIANEKRRKILEILLYDGEKSYSELMKSIGFRLGESSKFAYHIKRLEDSGLIEKKLSGKYRLTSRGREVAELLVKEEFEMRDPFTAFLDNVDLESFALGTIMFFAGTFNAITQFVYLLVWLTGLSFTIEIGNKTVVKEINVYIVVAILAASLATLYLSLNLLASSSRKFTLLEKLIYQKFLFLMLVRTGKILRYILYFIVAIISCVILSLLPILL